jgi:hypothetical protein
MCKQNAKRPTSYKGFLRKGVSMETDKRIILWLILVFAFFLPASALTPTAPENCVWEISSIEYDSPITEATDLGNRTETSTSNYDTASIHRTDGEHRSALGTCSLFGQNAEFKAAEGLSVASSGGGRILPMTFVRTVNQGEKIADLINEGKVLTFQSGNEHALVTLANGDRAIVSGGPGGIRFPDGSIKNIFGHTHPTSAGPSDEDSEILEELNQSQQTVFHGGLVSKVRQ